MKFFDWLRKRLQYLGETKEDKVLLTMSERQGTWLAGDLAKETGFGLGTTLRLLSQLEDKGWVRVTTYNNSRITSAGIVRVSHLRLKLERPQVKFSGRRWE